MDDGVECESIPPRLREVLHVDVGVAVRGLLRPPEKRLLRGNVLLANDNVRNLEGNKENGNG